MPYIDPIKKGFLTTKGTKKHELFLELGSCGDRNFQNFFCNASQWQQKANLDDEVSGLDIRFPKKFSCLLVCFRC